MTDLQTSVSWASRYGSADALRQAVRDRLLSGNVSGLDFGKTDEHPEDVIVTLLNAPTLLEDWWREAVVAGWGEARRLVDPVLENLPCVSVPSGEFGDAFARVFRVAERTGHERLRNGVFSDLQLAIGHPDTSQIYFQQVVAAASVYEPRESDRALWEPALEIEDIAAYAFQSLIRIGSARNQISEFLERLIQHQFVDEWDISVFFIAEFATTAFGADLDIVAALRKTRAKNLSLWQQIKQIGPQDPCWSDSWVSKVEGQAALDRDIVAAPQKTLEKDPQLGLKIKHTAAQDQFWLDRLVSKVEGHAALEMRNRPPTPRVQHSEQAESILRPPAFSAPRTFRKQHFIVGDVQGSASILKGYKLLLQCKKPGNRINNTRKTLVKKQLLKFVEQHIDTLLDVSYDYDLIEVKKHA
ncbi:MAG: hypothetical protein HQ546_07290 [Planctomycetes bacterium]|nr:hypothetical protein [Planctomycetota bacterium]